MQMRNGEYPHRLLCNHLPQGRQGVYAAEPLLPREARSICCATTSSQGDKEYMLRNYLSQRGKEYMLRNYLPAIKVLAQFIRC